MHVDRELLLNALQLTTHGLSDRGVVDQSGCYVFKDKRVITFNDEVACSCETELDINGAVPAAPLRDMLAKLTEPQLDITERDEEIVIKGKRKKVRITKQKEDLDYLKNLEIPKRWKKLPEDFSEAVEFVHECASKDEAKFILTCIHLNKKYLEAFDNWQFARYKLKMDLKTDFLVRQPSLKAIVTLAMSEFSEGKEWVHFRNEEKLTISCRRWMDDYQQMSAVAKVKGKKAIFPKGLIEAADRAEVLADNNVPKTQKVQIRVDLTPGKIVLQGEGPYGSYQETRKVRYGGKALSFMIPPRMLIQLLKRQNKLMVTKNLLKVEFGKKGVFVTSLAPAPLKGK